MGPDIADALQAVVSRAWHPAHTLRAAVLGGATLVITATTLFVQLQDALNLVWHVRGMRQEGLVRGFLRKRLLGLVLVLGMGLLVFVSLLVSTALTAGTDVLARFLPGSWPQLAIAAEYLTFIPVATLLFAMIFKLLPDAEIAWRDVWKGALVTAGLFALGRSAIPLYIARMDLGSVYGPAGAVVVLLFWVYVSALIFFLGAEFTYVEARRAGRTIKYERHEEEARKRGVRAAKRRA